MWSVLGTLLLVVGSVVLAVLVAFGLALVLPVRAGVSARAGQGLQESVVGLRPWGGVVGIGIRVRRSTSDSGGSVVLTIGIMAWRTFRPIRTLSAGPELTEELPVPSPIPEAETRDEAGYEAGTERGEASDDDVREPEQPVPTPEPSAWDERSSERPFERPAQSRDPGQIKRAEGVDQKTAEPPSTGDAATVSFQGEPEERVRQLERPATETRHAPPKKEPAPESGLLGRIETVRALWREWYPTARRVLRRLRGVVRLKLFRVRGSIGTGDPALTGLALSAVQGLRALEDGPMEFDVSGNFTEASAAGSVEAEWRISLLRIWSAALCAGWALFRRWRTARRESRQEE